MSPSGRASCLLLLVLALVLAVGALVWTQVRPGSPGTKSVKILFRENQSVREIADTLEARGVIRYPLLFRLMTRALAQDHRVKAGRYTFLLGGSEYQAVRRLSQEGEKNAFVTIPEGLRLERIADRLEAEAVCSRSAFLGACKDTAFLRTLDIPGKTAEGYLFPDSYYFPFDSDPEEVIRIMHRRFLSIVGSLIPGPRSLTPDLAILASLVEAEAERDTERPLVASVFLNRLKRGMPLQSCATVEYILPERKARLRESDLKIESPYNTYLHPGLPPGPICCPGKSSLKAALFPARTDYLYFVSKGNGWHQFSATYTEHLAAKRRYGQKGRDR